MAARNYDTVSSVEAFRRRWHEITNSTDTLRGTAQACADFYHAVSTDRTYREDGKMYIFHLGSEEYMSARWLFQRMIAVAYPYVKAEDVYTEWLMRDEITVTVAECVEITHRKAGRDINAWDMSVSRPYGY